MTKIRLHVGRYHGPCIFDHVLFMEAAKDAICQLENDQSYPEKITDSTGKILWKHDGPMGIEIDRLRRYVKRGDS